MAVFLDLENIALGAKTAQFPPFNIMLVLERLLLRGHIVVKKAYCDFDRYKEFKKDLHEAAFELIEIPHVRQSGKNSADIRMVVDALDLCYTKKHLDTFVILSGDSDFSPLVSKLRENAKTVVGVGVKSRVGQVYQQLRPVPRTTTISCVKSSSAGGYVYRQTDSKPKGAPWEVEFGSHARAGA